jgi:undecaprenyl-diphosphatase
MRFLDEGCAEWSSHNMLQMETLSDGSRFSRLVYRDTKLLLMTQRWRWPYATRFFRTITHMGNASVWFALWVVLVASGGEALKHAMSLGLSATLGALLAQVFKRAWRRPRPSAGIKGFEALMENPDAFSFPSGHTTTAVAVAVALTGAGVCLGTVAWGFAIAVGISRIYLGAHYPTDVGVGAVLGTLAGGLTAIVVG